MNPPQISCAPAGTEAQGNGRGTENVAAEPIGGHFYQGAYDHTGEAIVGGWDQFAAEIAVTVATAVADEKEGLPAFAPHVGPRHRGHPVTRVTAGYLDLDDLTDESLAALVAAVDGLDAIIHTTPSDRGPGTAPRKARAYFRTDREMTADECPRFRRGLALALGVVTDGQTLDAARIGFAGRIAGTAPREVWHMPDGGDAVPVDEILALVPEVPRAAAQALPVEYGGSADWIAGALEVLEPLAVMGQRHRLALGVGGYCRTRGIPEDQAVALIRALPTDDPDRQERTVLDAYARTGSVAGWTILAELGAGPDVENAIPNRVHERLEREAAERRALPGGAKPANEPSAAVVAANDVRADDPDPAGRGDPRSDLGNAQRLVRMHGERIRYCPQRRVWYVWNATLWRADETGEIERLAKTCAKSLATEAAEIEDDDRRKKAYAWASQCQNAGRIENAIKLARTEPGIPVLVTDLDADPWLLNVRNGTLDLQTGDLRAPDRSLLMTKCCATEYHRGARSDLWETFVKRTTGGDAELASYIQRALGYALFGEWREKMFWFGYGPPDGAKSTLLGVVGRILGDYHVSADPETWMTRHNVGGNRGDVTRLLGARLVTSLEVRPGLRFDAALMKKVTGGDKIVAAAKYEGEIEFPPTFALWFGANDRPAIADDDEGFWNRVRCVPFTNPVPRAAQDKALAGKLTSDAHAPGILEWLVAGCLAWQRDGIGTCEAVEKATTSYRTDMNRAAGFFEECCELTGNPGDEVPCSVMRGAYERWCDANGVRAKLSPQALGQRLRALGVTGGDDSTRRAVPDGPPRVVHGARPHVERHWRGVRLRVE